MPTPKQIKSLLGPKYQGLPASSMPLKHPGRTVLLSKSSPMLPTSSVGKAAQNAELMKDLTRQKAQLAQAQSALATLEKEVLFAKRTILRIQQEITKTQGLRTGL